VKITHEKKSEPKPLELSDIRSGEVFRFAAGSRNLSHYLKTWDTDYEANLLGAVRLEDGTNGQYYRTCVVERIDCELVVRDQ
jgi:hypothetical protein